jgi:predicted lipid-binding transport protein (Tim44 family)
MAAEVITEQETGMGRVGDLLHRITDDIKVLAKNELELAKGEVQSTTKTAAGESAVIVLGGIVALIGLGMLCASAVVALDALIPSLALRLLLMAIIYIAIGGVVAGLFAKRLKRDIVPDTTVPSYEAKRTIAGVKHALTTNERPSHA